MVIKYITCFKNATCNKCDQITKHAKIITTTIIIMFSKIFQKKKNHKNKHVCLKYYKKIKKKCLPQKKSSSSPYFYRLYNTYLYKICLNNSSKYIQKPLQILINFTIHPAE